MGNVSSRIINSIPLWKKQYGSIYYIKIKDKEYVFRVLSKGEYSSMLAIQNNFGLDVGDMILKECLLYPKFSKSIFDKKLAGEVDSLINVINVTSGFSSGDKIFKDLEAARNDTGILDNQIAIIICKAFPHLTPKDINTFTYEDILKYLAISESILDVKLNIEKPNSSKPGTIDFDKDNQDMGDGPGSFSRHLKPNQRGDAGK